MATMINAYSVGLTLDAGSYIKNSNLSRQETAKLTRSINGARTPAENYARQLDLIDKALQKKAISQRTANRLTSDAAVKLDKASSAIGAYNRGIAGATTANTRHGASLTTLSARYLSVAAAASALRRSLTLSAEIEQSTAAFSVFTGSMESAQGMMQEIRDFSASNPIRFTAAQQAARTLLSFNVDQRRILPTLRMLSDVTGANNERFKSMALAFAQMSAAGRLLGQDLRQMVDAGFNPLQEISLGTGKSLVELKADMEAGAISSQMVADAFKSATDEGGRFHGMTERLGNTLGGSMARAQSRIDVMAANLGDRLAPATVKVLNTFEKWSPSIERSLNQIGLLADGVAGLVELMDFTQTSLESLNTTGLNLGSMISGGLTGLATEAADIFPKLMLGTNRQVNEALLDARKNLGRGIFSDAENRRLDQLEKRYEELAKKRQELGKQVTPQPQPASGVDFGPQDELAARDEAFRKSAESHANRLAEAIERERQRTAQLRFGTQGAAKLELAMQGVSEATREWMKTSFDAGVRLDILLSQAEKGTREALREIDARQEVNRQLEERNRLAKEQLQLSDKIERAERRLAIIRQQDVKDRAAREQELVNKLSAPRSITVGSEQDLNRQAEQSNRAMIQQAIRNSQQAGLLDLSRDGTAQKQKEQLDELKALKKQQAENQQILNNLLATSEQNLEVNRKNGFKRLR